MKLTLLGTGDFRPYRPLGSAGYTLTNGDDMLQLDFGRGNLVNMAKSGIDWTVLHAVCISHVHPDHISDLFQFLQAWTVTNAWKEIDSELVIYGPRGFSAFFEHYRTVLVTTWDKLPQIVEIYDDTFTVQGFTVTTKSMQHSTDCNGYRVEAGGKVLCYTGDTEINSNLLELAQGADVLLTECSGKNADELLANQYGHLRPTDIAAIANQSGVKKVVVTHYPDDPAERELRIAEIAKEYKGQIIRGEDLLEIDF
ncbi:MAG: hypothetical protein COW24_04935 [Candidatus Kerfeldbacteria bacterium CG15_BIG_FIL_POST_REV_8_21_14_020_45_12]|uniref:Metallo-beta-lactamase domain-containing protein n=1 Tax=Candidatus Kerfeldbacteria bacterium CG15_BIG_FIL_POST_REV_8_21_14_020_45_12 TaxID=2014247 RepID=A0A2M7H2Q9_9BACT|nr:MAG: hypothetical protein COW24_04935 [Candidatus Kerfeldbacteria bacterium CG15_BIG_FIL_POST_REV_8_21_14_020_45_12]PJA93238.1 MAG: hypothetical protein CO132_03980 [Candidatus Kerfeldbacteria bacterium CG_4_9_14_3_um_filter_45_8]